MEDTAKIIITGLYQEGTSKRCPVYTTKIKSTAFGGTHFTLESLMKSLLKIPRVSVYKGTNANYRETIAKTYKITIEEIKTNQ